MDNTLNRVRTGWAIFRSCSMICGLLGFYLIVNVSPPLMELYILPGVAIGVGLVLISVFAKSEIWAKMALLTQAVLFSFAILAYANSRSAPNNLPMLLLTFITILFNAEMLTRIPTYQKQFSMRIEDLVNSANSISLKKSLDQLYVKQGRLAIILGTSFLLTIVVLLLGTTLGSAAPILSDPSLYMVVVSISLMFLLALREK